MTTAHQEHPRPQPDTTKPEAGEFAVETGIDNKGIDHKRIIFQQLEDQLGKAQGATVELENQVEDEVVGLGIETALANFKAVAADNSKLLELLPVAKTGSTRQLLEAARALQTDFSTTTEPQASFKERAQQFCRDKFSATLGDTAQALAEIVIPGLDLQLAKKMFAGEARTADFSRAVMKVIAPPFGELAYRALANSDEQTRIDLKEIALKQRLSVEMIKLIAVAFPEAAFVVRPTEAVVGSVAEEVETLTEQDDAISVWDQAKAIARGLMPKDPNQRRKLVEGLAKILGDDEALDQVGLGKHGRMIARMMAQAIEKDPTKVADAMTDLFASNQPVVDKI